MVQTLIEKHKPLNSREAIDALVSDLESNGIPYSNKLEVEISFEISKLKIQIYLKEHIRTLSRVSSEKFDIQSILKAIPIHSKNSVPLSNPMLIMEIKLLSRKYRRRKKRKILSPHMPPLLSILVQRQRLMNL